MACLFFKPSHRKFKLLVKEWWDLLLKMVLAGSKLDVEAARRECIMDGADQSHPKIQVAKM